MKLSSAGQKPRWQRMEKPKEKGDEDAAYRALLSARRPVTDDRRSRKRRVWLVLAGGHRAVRFVCARGSARTTPGTLSVRRDHARALACHGFVLVVGSADFRAGAGNPATCRPQPDWGIGDLCHGGDCAGCPGCDVETVAGGRFEGGVVLGRQSGAAGRGLRHGVCPVLCGIGVEYIRVLHTYFLCCSVYSTYTLW